MINKDFLYTLLDEIPVPVFYKDKDGRYLGFNKAFQTFFGATREELIGKTVFDVNPPELAKIYHAKDTELFEKRGVQQYESKVRDALGVMHDVIFNKAVFTDDHGAAGGLIGTILDITDRKKTEQRLEESEKRLRLTLEATRIGIWDWDVKNDLWYASPTYHTMLGYEPKTGLGDRAEWIERVHPDDRAHVAGQIRSVISQNFERYHYEARMRHADGSWRWHQVNGFGIERDQDGKVARMLGTRMDISDRKKSEQERLAHLRFFECMDQVNRAIQQADSLEQMMGDVLGAVLSIFDCDRVWLFHPCDPDARTFRVPMIITKLEYPAAGVLNADIPLPPDMAQNLREILASDDPVIYIAGTEKPINKVTAGRFGVQSQMVMVLHPKSGEPWVFGMHQCAYPRVWTNEESRLFREIGRRLSDALTSLLIMGNLRESEDKYRTLIQNIQAGVVVYKTCAKMSTWNKAAEKLLGLTGDQLLGETAPDPDWHFIREDGTVMPPEEHPASRVLATRQPLRNQVVGVHRPGKEKDGDVWILVNADPVIGKDDQITQVIVTFIDITERLSLESQLRQAQKLESVGRLAGGVAHDFNNMLGVILGHTELALDEADPALPLHASLKEIRKAAERSADLTRQLLAFARKQTVAPRVLDLNETVEGTLRMLRRLIGEDIALAWLPGKNLWPVKVDPTQIDQILANLCINARDAIAGVGKITIETENASFDLPCCAEQPGFMPGDFVMLAVSDDGYGIDKEIMDKIFEPFFTTKEVGQGTGLGLATVYGTVKQNNGFIKVNSEPGRGATFRIYLPGYAAGYKPKRKEGSAAAVARGDETILLVEDEPAILKMTRIMLEKSGYQVLSASTPGEAIRMAREKPGEIHLLIADVVMPEMNGRDLAKHLTSICQGLRRLFMSGYTADVIAHHGMLDEGIDFIQKPFSMQTLAAKVREVLDSR